MTDSVIRVGADFSGISAAIKKIRGELQELERAGVPGANTNVVRGVQAAARVAEQKSAGVIVGGDRQAQVGRFIGQTFAGTTAGVTDLDDAGFASIKKQIRKEAEAAAKELGFAGDKLEEAIRRIATGAEQEFKTARGLIVGQDPKRQAAILSQRASDAAIAFGGIDLDDTPAIKRATIANERDRLARLEKKQGGVFSDEEVATAQAEEQLQKEIREATADAEGLEAELEGLYARAKLIRENFDRMQAATAEYVFWQELLNTFVESEVAARRLREDPRDPNSLEGKRQGALGETQAVRARDRSEADIRVSESLQGKRTALEQEIYTDTVRQAEAKRRIGRLLTSELVSNEIKDKALKQDVIATDAIANLTTLEAQNKLRLSSLRAAQEALVAQALAAEAIGEGKTRGLATKQFKAEADQLFLSEALVREIAEQVRLEQLIKVSQKKRLAALDILVKQDLGAAALVQSGGGGRGGGRPVAPGTGAGGTDEPKNFLQRVNFAQGALGTLRYAIPSAILYGGFRALTNSVKTANELQIEFSIIENQLRSIGEEGAFERVRESVFATARATGQAVEEFAKLERQLIGAFSALDPQQNPELTSKGLVNLAEQQTRAAGELAEVVGLPLSEITDGLTAASIAFDATFRDIGDIVVSLEQSTGVLGKETVNFLGDIAPVAEEAKFDLEEISVLAAQVQQRSGRSGTTLAEQFNRIIPAVSAAKDELFALAAADPALEGVLGPLAENDIAQVFREIGAEFENLSTPSQTSIINLLGGRREAGALIPVLANIEQFNDLLAIADGSSGSLNDRFEAVRETLGNTFERLRETFKQLFVEIFESGFVDLFKNLATGVEDLITFVQPLVKLLTEVLSLFGGLPVKILAVVAAIKLLGSVNAFSKIGGGLRGGFQTISAGVGLAAEQARIVAADPSRGGPVTSRITGTGALSKAARGAGAGTAAFQSAVGGLPTAAITAGIVGFTVLKGKFDSYQQEIDELIDEVRANDESVYEILERADKLDARGASDPGFWEKVGAFITGNDIVTKAEALRAEALKQQNQGVIDTLDRAAVQGVDFEEDLRKAIEIREGILPNNYAAIVGNALVGATAEEINVAFPTLDESTIQNALDELSTLGLNRDLGIDVNKQRAAILEVERALNTEDGNPLALLQQLILETDDPELLELYAGAAEGILASLERTDPQLYSQISEALDTGQIKIGEVIEDQGDLVSAFEEGAVSQTQFIAEAKQLIARYRELGAKYPSNAAETIKQVNQLREKIADALIDDMNVAIGILERESGAGSDRAIEGSIERVETLLQNPDIGGEQLFDLVGQWYDLQRERRERLADLAATEEEAEAILNQEIVIPPEILQAITKANLERFLNINLEDLVINGAKFVGGITQEWIDFIITTATTSEDGENIVKEAAKAKRDQLLSQLVIAQSFGAPEEVINAIKASYNAVVEIIDNIGSAIPESTIGPDPQGADRAEDETEDNIRKAKVQVQLAQAQGDRVREAQIRLADAKDSLQEAIADKEKTSDDIEALARVIEAEKNLEEALQEVAQEYRKAAAGFDSAVGNAVEAAAANAQIAIEDYAFAVKRFGEGSPQAAAARTQVAQALVQQRDAFNSRQQEFAGLLLQLNNLDENAKSLAEVEVYLAQEQLNRAIGVDDRLAAQRRLISAQKELNKVMQDIRLSRLELNQIELEVQEEDYFAALKALEIAREQLANAQSNGAGEAEINRLQGAVLQASKNAQDTRVSEAREEYDFLYEMERITKQQYIAYLEALKSSLAPGTDAFRELELTLKRLKDDISGDLQTNLPTALNLPTLYEARRLNQTTSAGSAGQAAIGYQDNRNMQVTVYVNNGMSEGQVVSALSQAVGLGRNGFANGVY